MLPMIVSMNLAKQAFKLSKQKTIVKNINSIQSFGAMDVLCTDKTGTLTEDRIVLQKHVDINNTDNSRVLIYSYLNSHFQTGLKNLLDLAIIDKAKIEHHDKMIDEYRKIDEIPFDFNRRRMSVVLRDSAGKNLLITKGASEEILSICTHVDIDGKKVKLTPKLKEKANKVINYFNSQGMRVIAVASNIKPVREGSTFNISNESNMKLIGFVALLDPPKTTAKKAIQGLQKKGVDIKVLTGDNETVTKYICSQVGINIRHILLGSDVENMTADELKLAVNKTNVFAKLSPEQKARIVLAIKSNKHVVGYMGDGINDAAAMRAADISISVDTAVDIAKETADIILLEKDLTILGTGAIEGRKTYANIIKYIKMTISSNFGNMLSMLSASV
jgi:Mg2+-importing ATPase